MSERREGGKGENKKLGNQEKKWKNPAGQGGMGWERKPGGKGKRRKSCTLYAT